jgi:hypothetical protein
MLRLHYDVIRRDSAEIKENLGGTEVGIQELIESATNRTPQKSPEISENKPHDLSWYTQYSQTRDFLNRIKQRY